MSESALAGRCLFSAGAGGAIVFVMRARGGMRARFAAAILSLALVYAFMCSATCAICLGSNAATSTAADVENHACEHSGPDAGGGAQKRCPAKRDCFAHHHSGFEFLQSDEVMQFRLSISGHASQLFGGSVRTEAAVEVASFRSDLAPPLYATMFPQQKVSILRI